MTLPIGKPPPPPQPSEPFRTGPSAAMGVVVIGVIALLFTVALILSGHHG